MTKLCNSQVYTHNVVNIESVCGEGISDSDVSSQRVHRIVVRCNSVPNDVIVYPANKVTVYGRHSVLTSANLNVLRVTESIWRVHKHGPEAVPQYVHRHSG